MHKIKLGVLTLVVGSLVAFLEPSELLAEFTTLTFSSPGPGTGIRTVQNPQIVGEYRFTSSATLCSPEETAFSDFYAGRPSLAVCNAGAMMTISRVDGKPFTLYELLIAPFAR